MLRARLLLSRVLVSCSCAFISWSGPPVGTPCFLFYRRRESVGYRGGKGEEREREEGFQDRWILFLLHPGPTNLVDVNRDGSTSRPCSSLASCAGVICRSWRSIPSWRKSW